MYMCMSSHFMYHCGLSTRDIHVGYLEITVQVCSVGAHITLGHGPSVQGTAQSVVG